MRWERKPTGAGDAAPLRDDRVAEEALSPAVFAPAATHLRELDRRIAVRRLRWRVFKWLGGPAIAAVTGWAAINVFAQRASLGLGDVVSIVVVVLLAIGLARSAGRFRSELRLLEDTRQEVAERQERSG